jgi:hypothetical protein
MMYLRQSTAVDVPVGPFLDETDGKTAETALTITQPDIRLKKNGGAWAQKSAAQTLTHEEAGWYEVSLSTTDTDTVGHLVLAVHESGALPVWREFTVLEEAIYDALFAASANAFSGAAGSTTLTALAAGSVTAAVIATGAIDADAIADNAIDAGAIAADAITAAKIATDAITAAKIATGAITAAKFAAGAIDAAAIAADAIGAAEVSAAAVTKIQTGLSTHTAGDVWAVAGRTLTAFAFEVTVGANNDKTGYALSAAGVDAIWDEAQAGHATAGTFGLFLDAAVSSRSSHSAADVWAVASRTLTAFGFSVTVGTNNDKTGYALSSAGLDAVVVYTDAATSRTLNPRQALAAVVVGMGITTGNGTTSVTAAGPSVAVAGTPGWSFTLDGTGNHTVATFTPPA